MEGVLARTEEEGIGEIGRTNEANTQLSDGIGFYRSFRGFRGLIRNSST